MRAIAVSFAAGLALIAIASMVAAQESGGTETSEPLVILSDLGLTSDTGAAGRMSFAGLSREETYAECCRICRKGKACGDSCIQRSKTCHVGPGCACDGE